MAEIEVHTGHHAEDDPLGKRVGFQVGLIGILLAVVTIAAHREHTAAVIHRTESNDQWSYYQAKKIREHTSTVGEQVVALLDPARADAAKGVFAEQIKKYAADAEGIKKQAEAEDAKTEHSEFMALRFDLGEGLLELGLVLSSLYFLGRRKLFPVAGGAFALVGVATALSVLLG
jgi:hypothetical protein